MIRVTSNPMPREPMTTEILGPNVAERNQSARTTRIQTSLLVLQGELGSQFQANYAGLYGDGYKDAPSHCPFSISMYGYLRVLYRFRDDLPFAQSYWYSYTMAFSMLSSSIIPLNPKPCITHYSTSRLIFHSLNITSPSTIAVVILRLFTFNLAHIETWEIDGPPFDVIVTIRDSGNYTRILLSSYHCSRVRVHLTWESMEILRTSSNVDRHAAIILVLLLWSASRGLSSISRY